MMHRNVLIASLLVVLVLPAPVAGTSLNDPDLTTDDTGTGDGTASDAADAVTTAEETVKETASTVASDSTDGASEQAEASLDRAKDKLDTAKTALNRSANATESAAAATAQARQAQRIAIATQINVTRERLATFAQTHDRLDTAVNTLAEQDIRMNRSRAALQNSSHHMTVAAEQLGIAADRLDAGNVTAADAAMDRARERRQQARQTLRRAPVKAEITAGISTTVADLAAMKTETKRSVEQAENTFGTGVRKRQAASEYAEGEQAYEEGKQSTERISSAATLAEMAESAESAATSLAAAEQQLQSAQEQARQARSLFFRHALLAATFLAVMGGGGFLYYRMNGGYKPDEQLEAAKKALGTDDSEAADDG
jgi:hypothetical protein